MNKNYVTPWLEVIRSTTDDVITSSPTTTQQFDVVDEFNWDIFGD